MPRFRDTFDDESPASSDSSESEPETELRSEAAAKILKRVEPSHKALEEVGYKSGPSVLTIREPAEPQFFGWSKGQRESSEPEEDFEKREQARAAATHATEMAVRRAIIAKQEAAKKLHEVRDGHAQSQQNKRENFQQREKRKRELGQAKKGKNYVEEEKRLLRQHNVYSGFDN